GAQQLRPEQLVAVRIQRTQSNMAEASNARIARRKITPAAMLRSIDQVNAVARWVLEIYEVAHVALLGLGGRPLMHLAAIFGQYCSSMVQLLLRVDFKCRGMVARIALCVAQRVVAAVRAQVDRLAFAAGNLQTEDVGGVAHRCLQIGSTQPDI